MEQSDEELARFLQAQEYEAVTGHTTNLRSGTSASPITLPEDDDYNNDGGSGDLGLDSDAPFKDLHGLFLAFNDQYFESKLSACEIRWSPRMTRWYGSLLACLPAYPTNTLLFRWRFCSCSFISSSISHHNSQLTPPPPLRYPMKSLFSW